MNHSHPREPQYFINSGVQTGQTTYVYPPEGYTMSNLNAFIPSVNTMSIDTEEEKTAQSVVLGQKMIQKLQLQTTI